MEQLITEAGRLGVTIRYADLPPPMRGAYLPRLELIMLDKALILPQQRETLAHELGHALHGHNCTNATTEAQAWKRAAWLTVDADEYARAESINPHPAAIALELDLTPRLIIEWQRNYGHKLGRIFA